MCAAGHRLSRTASGGRKLVACHRYAEHPRTHTGLCPGAELGRLLAGLVLGDRVGARCTSRGLVDGARRCPITGPRLAGEPVALVGCDVDVGDAVGRQVQYFDRAPLGCGPSGLQPLRPPSTRPPGCRVLARAPGGAPRWTYDLAPGPGSCSACPGRWRMEWRLHRGRSTPAGGLVLDRRTVTDGRRRPAQDSQRCVHGDLGVLYQVSVLINVGDGPTP